MSPAAHVLDSRRGDAIPATAPLSIGQRVTRRPGGTVFVVVELWQLEPGTAARHGWPTPAAAWKASIRSADHLDGVMLTPVGRFAAPTVAIAVHELTAVIGCGFEWSGYPHPGCSEFGEPDHYSCPADADRLVWFPPSEAYDPADGALVPTCPAHEREVLNGGAVPPGTAVISLELLPLRCSGCREPLWPAHPDEHARCMGCMIAGLDGDHPGCSCPVMAAYEAAEVTS